MGQSDKKVAEFHRAVRAALRPMKNAERAAGMRAYMRNQFEYLGVSTPDHRAAVAPLIKSFSPADREELRMAAEGLWQMREREYQYVALGLLARYQKTLTLADLSWLLDLVQQKSWWDTVDSLVKAIGGVVQRAGAKGKRAMDAAVKHDNFWVRRIAMLHQSGCAMRSIRKGCFAMRIPGGGKRVLHPQGDRMGAARLRMARLARRGQIPEVDAR